MAAIAEAKGALHSLLNIHPADTACLYIDNLGVVQTWGHKTRDDPSARMKQNGY